MWEIQAQDATGNWRTYHIANTKNPQLVLAEMKSLKNQFPDFRVRALDRTGRLIDLWNETTAQGPSRRKKVRPLYRERLDCSDKALRTTASNALIDVMHESRLVRFGAGEAHLGTAFHALRVFLKTLGLVLWHYPPHGWLLPPCKLLSTIETATNQNLPFTR